MSYFQSLVSILEGALTDVWSAEWVRDDTALELLAPAIMSGQGKEFAKALGFEVGRSHRDLIRWAAVAAAFPPGHRPFDLSQRTCAGMVRQGLTWRDLNDVTGGD